jgi:hypothetical protein
MPAIKYMFLIAALLVGLNGWATADVITDWNENAVAAGYKARVSPALSARNVAMVHVAMFEAVNSIETRYAPYRARLKLEPGASPELGRRVRNDNAHLLRGLSSLAFARASFAVK